MNKNRGLLFVGLGALLLMAFSKAQQKKKTSSVTVDKPTTQNTYLKAGATVVDSSGVAVFTAPQDYLVEDLGEVDTGVHAVSLYNLAGAFKQGFAASDDLIIK
jgi:hypothetical protein